MLTATQIESVLDLEDKDVTVDELANEHFDEILKRLIEGPVNCSEIGFQNSQQGACCCYDDDTPQTFGTCV